MTKYISIPASLIEREDITLDLKYLYILICYLCKQPGENTFREEELRRHPLLWMFGEFLAQELYTLHKVGLINALLVKDTWYISIVQERSETTA